MPTYTLNTLKAFPTADGFGKYATGGRVGTSKGKKFYQGNTILKRAKLG